ncbi:MAG: cytochrome C oxidase subunit IV family protein [Cyclobacteriaceae bacterium]|nr:cytochrome C oxidase subunit IV family protein [Cyclobacteriaceae bacterium]
MESHENISSIEVKPADKAKIRHLLKVALILFVITVLEFGVAFLMPHEMHTIKVWIFIGMTIIKAAYIIGEFMHLAHEVKSLMWSVVLPMVFVIWLIIALMYEGNSVLNSIGG